MADTENGVDEQNDDLSRELLGETDDPADGDVSNDPAGGDSVEGGATEDNAVEDPELEAIKARVREMEEEAEKLKEMQKEVETQMNMGSPTSSGAASVMSPENKKDADARSIYVGNVDYGATAEELEAHFHGCGSVNRVTILCDKFSGHPKGFAYIEFADKDAVTTAQSLDESLFRGRQIKVGVKRTNLPGTTIQGKKSQLLFPILMKKQRSGVIWVQSIRCYSDVTCRQQIELRTRKEGLIHTRPLDSMCIKNHILGYITMES
ncbi:unnamed protein product [Owenia fusiformis]|uniref:RRM domain-containing protein n=1 Tax=Owenia fusiformis TaxID=6347 RepID=A0A8S4NG09_OWEFU|nr:unnamed protein product [Owenia fusiformis]